MNSRQRELAIGDLHGIIHMARDLTERCHRVIAQLEADAPLDDPIEPMERRLKSLEERMGKAEMHTMVIGGAVGSDRSRPFVGLDDILSREV